MKLIEEQQRFTKIFNKPKPADKRSTPLALAQEMVSKIPEEVIKNKNSKFLDPCAGTGTFLVALFDRLSEYHGAGHIMSNMLYGYDNTITSKTLLIKLGFKNIERVDFLNTELDMKFDVIIVNPPYQKSTGASRGITIWPFFVERGFELLKDGGYLSMIHPNTWRHGKKTTANVLELFTNNNIIHLQLGNVATGKEIFGVTTSVDWYVIQKSPNQGSSHVVDTEGVSITLDLSGVKRLPDSHLDLVGTVIDLEDLDTVDILYNTKYHTQKEYVVSEKSEEYKYPLVYTLKQGGPTFKWTNDNTKAFFGVPKIVLASGLGYPVLDLEGKYGTCEFSYSIVDSPENLLTIYDKLMDPVVLNILKDMGSGKGHNYLKQAVSLLKKDFWRYI